MDENLKQKIALFRYSLIAPILTNTFTQESAKAYLEEVCVKTYQTHDGKAKEFAPETLKDWLRLYRKHGIDGLYPKTRADKGKSRVLPEEAKKHMVECKAASPKRSAKSIYHELIAKGFVKYDGISLPTVQRFLSKLDASLIKDTAKDRRAFEFEFPNQCWQSDISVGPYLTIGGRKYKTYIIAIIDDASRLMIHCEAFFEDNLMGLLKVMKLGVAKRGIPKKLFVDNGKVYKSDQLQYICASLGTILCYAKPYSPESKGKIERWFKTLQDQFLNVVDWTLFKSLEDFNAALTCYVEQQYNSRVHSSIKQKPIDKFTDYIENIRFVPGKQELDNIFLYRTFRTVKNDATISLNSILFEVPMQYVRNKIQIRYDPSSMDKAYIFSEDNKIVQAILPVKKIDNSKIRRNNDTTPVDFSPFVQIKDEEVI